MTTLKKSYAGVGSRSTPEAVLAEMATCARMLARLGCTLRSGAADGADRAFERGCDAAYGAKEIFLPWKYFNKHPSRLYFIPEDAFKIAETLHERFQYLKAPVKRLHARNVLQILGQEINDPVAVVLCWTPGAAIVGGTATAIKLAADLEIPVINFARPSYKDELIEHLELRL